MQNLSLVAGPVLKQVLLAEEKTLSELGINASLKALVSSPYIRQIFAIMFYFIRYDFYRHNFIIGSRCSPDESQWSGLVLNLFSELGGGEGKSHNQLYRDFLNEVGIPDEPQLSQQPEFAKRFNEKWEMFCKFAPLNEALSAISIYEILDRPDYAMLLEVMKHSGIGEKGLKFFEVHATADHFEFFETLISKFQDSPLSQNAVTKATEFVLNTQREMWRNLLDYLSNCTEKPVG